MNVLFLGGTGFVGSHAVRHLANLGHDVTVVHRGQTEPDLPQAVRHVHHPDLGFGRNDRFLSGVAGELRRLQPEVVVDMNPSSELDAQIVMRTFRGIARRVVGISSMDVYRAYAVMHRREPGPPQAVPLTEDGKLREAFFIDSPRGEKILAERVLLGDDALPGTVLRWPMVYGAGDPVLRTFSYLRHMDAGRTAILIEEGHAARRASRGYTENVALSVVMAVTNDRAAGRVYNVGEPDALTEAEWVQEIAGAAGWNGRIVTVPRGDALPHFLPKSDTSQHWVVDTTRVRGELGYREPVSRPKALRRTIDWERSNPPRPERIPPDEEMEERFAAEDRLLAQLAL